MSAAKPRTTTRYHLRRDLPWEILADVYHLCDVPSHGLYGLAFTAHSQLRLPNPLIHVVECQRIQFGQCVVTQGHFPPRGSVAVYLTVQAEARGGNYSLLTRCMLNPGDLQDVQVPQPVFTALVVAIAHEFLTLFPRKD